MKVGSTNNGDLHLNINYLNDNDQKTNSDAEKKNGNVFYAGDANLNNDPIELKKQQAQKQALKAIMDQYKNDLKTDDIVNDCKDKKEKYQADMDLAASEIISLRTQKQELKEECGITDDSDEEKNLQLLEKSLYGDEDLTEDEMNQLQNMGSLTEYQKTALQYDSMEEIWSKRLDNAKNGVAGMSGTIIGISLEKLKTHPMVDAQKQAIDIIETANKEVSNTILQQAKESVDETMDENKEEVQKQQEAKEEEEAKKEKAEENKDTQSGQTSSDKPIAETTLNIVEQTDYLQQVNDLKRFTAKQNMLEEDIKGIVVDEEV